MTREQEQLAREAKAIVALAFRNGPIEDCHAGLECPKCAGRSRYSGITQSEMKEIMKAAVNRMYTLLLYRSTNRERFDAMMRLGSLFTRKWDKPIELSPLDF